MPPVTSARVVTDPKILLVCYVRETRRVRRRPGDPFSLESPTPVPVPSPASGNDTERRSEVNRNGEPARDVRGHCPTFAGVFEFTATHPRVPRLARQLPYRIRTVPVAVSRRNYRERP